MYKNKMILLTWNGLYCNGAYISFCASKYYRREKKMRHDYPIFLKKILNIHRKEMRKWTVPILENIKTYNKIDCQMIWEIVNYLRLHNTKQK